jgi:hypothetical protein
MRVLTMTLALLAALPAAAEIRRHDPASGVSTAVTAPANGSLGGVRTGGSAQNIGGVNRGTTAPASGVRVEPKANAPYVPRAADAFMQQVQQDHQRRLDDMKALDAAATAEREQMRKDEATVAYAAVFLDEASLKAPQTVKDLERVARIPNLLVSIYLRDTSGRPAVDDGVANPSLAVAPNVSASVDEGNEMADLYNVRKYPLIVYTEPTGSMKRLDLASVASLENEVKAARQAVQRK